MICSSWPTHGGSSPKSSLTSALDGLRSPMNDRGSSTSAKIDPPMTTSPKPLRAQCAAPQTFDALPFEKLHDEEGGAVFRDVVVQNGDGTRVVDRVRRVPLAQKARADIGLERKLGVKHLHREPLLIFGAWRRRRRPCRRFRGRNLCGTCRAACSPHVPSRADRCRRGSPGCGEEEPTTPRGTRSPHGFVVDHQDPRPAYVLWSPAQRSPIITWLGAIYAVTLVRVVSCEDGRVDDDRQQRAG